MCGIAGILTAPGRAVPDGALDAITDALSHRGPDARGVFCDAGAGVHLGHRRLSILDLSPGGAQPMTSRSGRTVMVLNGEIYNYAELRAELDRPAPLAWRGTSDTEVILELCDRHGIEEALRRAEGMFAIAVWIVDRGELILARDRFGEKPLFYGETADGLVFGSELKSVMRYPGFTDQLDDTAIDLFLQLSYIPEPRTPFRRVRKLPAGHFARLKPGDRSVRPQPYWNAARAALDARLNAAQTGATEDEIVASLEQRLLRVVERQMIADVPVGAFLSGGIDSSLIVALMQQTSRQPVRTFTIGFNDERYDEAPYARAIARHLGTDHTEAMLDWREGLDLVDALPEIYSEPFADSSQLPTYLVSRIARRSVAVSLSGDAGDEVFGGYNRHVFARQYERARGFVPGLLRQPAGAVLKALAAPNQAERLERLQGLAGGGAKVRLLGEKLAKLGAMLQEPNDLEGYLRLIRRDEGLIAGDCLRDEFQSVVAGLGDSGHTLAETYMLLDTATYLPGDILTKVDRAAMAVSLETRIPYLDHEVFALAWSLPIGARIKAGKSKSVLRHLLGKHVPPALFERPKAGFGVPIETWLKGPLKGWLADKVGAFALSCPRHAAVAGQAHRDFVAGRSHAHHFLWNVAMLQGWLKAYGQA